MSNALAEWHPVLQALVAGLFTWTVTALGAGLVFLGRELSERTMDAMLGFASGVMLAASFWSLLQPAVELAEQQGMRPWIPAVAGFALGGLALRLGDALLPHLHPGAQVAEGRRSSYRRSTLLVLAITLHNIPEGLAVGVAFGSVGQLETGGGQTLGAALALAIGIGIQNFPEGASVAVPLRRDGVSRGRSFWYGQLSGVVEPLAAVGGAVAALTLRPVLPYALAFAAGAMVYVVVEELVPESQRRGHSDVATLGAMGGFSLMMLLDVALG